MAKSMGGPSPTGSAPPGKERPAQACPGKVPSAATTLSLRKLLSLWSLLIRLSRPTWKAGAGWSPRISGSEENMRRERAPPGAGRRAAWRGRGRPRSRRALCGGHGRRVQGAAESASSSTAALA